MISFYDTPCYDDPLWKKVLKCFFKWLGILFLWFIGFIVFFLLLMTIPQPKYHYEYIDLDNNKGIAKECSYKFKEGKAGGQGSPVCTLADGTVKQVKEYKYIYEGEYKPIDEIFKGE